MIVNLLINFHTIVASNKAKGLKTSNLVRDVAENLWEILTEAVNEKS